MFNVALFQYISLISNLYRSMESCHLQATIPSNQFELLSNYLHSYLFQFNKCFACFKLIKCHCFKQINFSKIVVLNKVNIHKIERILKNISVLSRGWHDSQQVRHSFIFLVWWYLHSSDLC